MGILLKSVHIILFFGKMLRYVHIALAKKIYITICFSRQTFLMSWFIGKCLSFRSINWMLIIICFLKCV